MTASSPFDTASLWQIQRVYRETKCLESLGIKQGNDICSTVFWVTTAWRSTTGLSSLNNSNKIILKDQEEQIMAPFHHQEFCTAFLLWKWKWVQAPHPLARLHSLRRDVTGINQHLSITVSVCQAHLLPSLIWGVMTHEPWRIVARSYWSSVCACVCGGQFRISACPCLLRSSRIIRGDISRGGSVKACALGVHNRRRRFR